MNEVYAILFSIFAIAGYFFAYYFHIKAEIYSETEKAVDKAEQSDKSASEKMDIAVEHIYTLVPASLKGLFPKKLIKRIVQRAFDSIENYARKQVEKRKGEGVEDVNAGDKLN